MAVIGAHGSRWTLVYWGAAALALVTPLVAMQFTEEVDWSPLDFVFIGALLGFVGLGIELVVRRSGSIAYRAAAAVALMTALLLVWINGAVGIIGNEHEDANVLFAGVLAVALLGALVARFRPGAMSWVMVAAALVQALVPAIAPIFGPGSRAAAWEPKTLVLSGGFAAMWLLSAWLFRKAARRGLAA